MDINASFPSHFLKAKVNCKQDDIIKILDEGVVDTDAQGKLKLTLKVSINGEEKLFGCNATNRKLLTRLYGSNTKNWVGKELMINIVKVNNPATGQLTDSIALSHGENF